MNDLMITGNQIKKISVDFTGYEKYLETIDVKAETRREYINRAKYFITFLNEKPFNPMTFLEYKRELDSIKHWSISTKNKYLISAKVLLNAMAKMGMIPDITGDIKVFKQTKKHKKDGVNETEIKQISQALTGTDARTRVIIALLTLQGLRQIELSRLNIEDINLTAGTALIQGKARDDKEIIYLHTDSIKVLKEYIKEYNVKSGALFFSLSNRGKNQRLSTRSIRGVVKNVFQKVNIEKSTHGLRHYFTTKLINHYQGNLLQVTRYTRHRSLEMLQVYFDDINAKDDLINYESVFQGVLA